MVRERYARGSSRSYGSSSTAEVRPREKIKDFCRKVVAFLCTQIGVGALVFGYTLVGAVSFMHIEQGGYDKKIHELEALRNNYSRFLYRVIDKSQVFVEEKNIFVHNVTEFLKLYQEQVCQLFRRDNMGFEERPMTELWTFPASLMFSLSIITMIGYGTLVPRTPYGKLATVIYALFGIPLYILYFLNFGDALASGFKWVYRKMYECSTEKNDSDPPKKIFVPSTACLWVIFAYIIIGAIIFSTWERWDFLDSIYFCVTSLCKLGFGDFVPGANILASNHGNQTKLVINYGYILLGMGLVAMCYNLMREEIKEKVKEVREDCAQCLEDTQMRFVMFCHRFRGARNEYYY